ncbi:MAG: hypothetical protein EOO61_13895 [Hymenobacter sp.]|nr:MAG: hypothetical protein EOO61_13895 [Hymenobacter sp.]
MKKVLGYTSDIKRNNILDALIFRSDDSEITHKPNRLHQDDHIMKVAIAKSPGCLVYASAHLRDDTALVRMAVRSWGKVLCAASDRLRDDIDTVRLAIVSEGDAAFGFASQRLQDDADLANEVKRHPSYNEKEASLRSMMRNLAPEFESPAYFIGEIEGDLMLSNRKR